MSQLLNKVSSALRQICGAASSQPRPRLIAAIEPLEGRQFFSASPVAHVEVHGAAPAVHASVQAAQAKGPVAIWNATARIEGVRGDKKFGLVFLSDSNGVVTARITGDGLGLKDVTMTGMHDSEGYHFTVGADKGSLNLEGKVGSNGKMTGAFVLSREGKVSNGTFTAVSAPLPAPKPAPTPKPAPAPAKEESKKTSDKKDKSPKHAENKVK